ncbi:MAG: hypothetical protein ACL93V_07685 [Candidatus Electrothrix sp. YB6]
MEELIFFRVINRINSVVFLLLLFGALFLILIVTFQSNKWQDRRTFEVIDNSNSEDANKIELILEGIHIIEGHDVQYIRLESKRSGGKFSSGYSGGQIRNILFLVGSDIDSHWLYEKHSNYIRNFSHLRKKSNGDKNEPVVALYIEVVKNDTNGDGELNDEDLCIIGLIKPNGYEYIEIEKSIQSVIDKEVSEDGEHLLILAQIDNSVWLKKYSLMNFKKVSEKVITEISKKL